MTTKFVILTCLALFLISIFITPEFIKIYEINNLSEPLKGQYTSDELSFLKTFYLMESGRNYYDAFKEARGGLANPDFLSSDTFLWRLPTSFLIWSFVAYNGQGILNLFLFFSLLFILAIYLLVKKFSNKYIGLLSGIIIVPYIIDTLRYKTAFLFTEWWGLFFYIFGLTFFVYQKKFWVIIFLSLAMLSRELFVLPVVVLLLLSLKQKKNFKTFLIPLIIFGIFYTIHSFQISEIINQELRQNFFARFHFYSSENLFRMGSFSMRNYVFFGIKTHLIILVICIILSFVTLFLGKDWILKGIIFASLVFLIVLPFVSVYDNDYWGILFVPTFLALGPLGLKFIKIK